MDQKRRLEEHWRSVPDWSNLNEAETRKLLIEPTLEGVGYGPLHLRHEQGAGGNRPDAMAYCDSGAAGAVAQASVIVEMKALNTDLDGAGQPRMARPTRQIRRYLKDHPASGPGTRGAVTDGNQWRVYERCGDADVRYVGQYRLFDDGGEASGLGELAGLIGRRTMETCLSGARRGRRNTRETKAALAVTELVRDNAEPAEILSALYDGETRPLDIGPITGKAKDAVREDWERAAFAAGPALLETPTDLFDRQCAVGSIRLKPSEGTERLHREDVALAARTAAHSGDGAAVVAVHEPGNGTDARGGSRERSYRHDPSVRGGPAAAGLPGEDRLVAQDPESRGRRRHRSPGAGNRHSFVAAVVLRGNRRVARTKAGRTVAARSRGVAAAPRPLRIRLDSEGGRNPSRGIVRGRDRPAGRRSRRITTTSYACCSTSG